MVQYPRRPVHRNATKGGGCRQNPAHRRHLDTGKQRLVETGKYLVQNIILRRVVYRQPGSHNNNNHCVQPRSI